MKLKILIAKSKEDLEEKVNAFLKGDKRCLKSANFQRNLFYGKFNKGDASKFTETFAAFLLFQEGKQASSFSSQLSSSPRVVSTNQESFESF